MEGWERLRGHGYTFRTSRCYPVDQHRIGMEHNSNLHEILHQKAYPTQENLRRGKTLTKNKNTTFPLISYLGQPLLVVGVAADVAVLEGGGDLVNLHPFNEDSVPVGSQKEAQNHVYPVRQLSGLQHIFVSRSTPHKPSHHHYKEY